VPREGAPDPAVGPPRRGLPERGGHPTRPPVLPVRRASGRSAAFVPGAASATITWF